MKFHLTILFFCIMFIGTAQNLVPNPSFEDYTTCPNSQCQIYRATGWQSFGYSPDYFNACGTHNWSVPQNIAGYQYAATGNAYIGIGTYSTIYNTREYIGIQLFNPLIIGVKYYVSFKAVLVKNANCATNKLGGMFSTVSYTLDTFCYANTLLPPSNYAQIYENFIITDTVNWTFVSDSIVADSSYNYIIIGNFFDDINTDTIKFNNNSVMAYYYIDDIYVGLSPNEIIENDVINNEIVIYPIPTSNNINIHINNPDLKFSTYKIFNTYGILLKQGNIFYSDKIDVSEYSEGVYILQIVTNNKLLNKKIIIKKP